LTCVATLAIGCASYVPEPAAETAVAMPAGQGIWSAGTSGFAAFWDGARLERRDYPRTAAAYMYEPFSLPAAHLVVKDDHPLLFTRAGEVLRWGWGSWARVSKVVFPEPWREHLQIDLATPAPDGSIFVQLHSDGLVWLLPGGGMRVERAPVFFTWMGYDGDDLLAIGWQGDERTVERRRGPGSWERLAVVGVERGRSVNAVIRIPEGPLAAVWSDGLAILEKGSAPRFVPLDAIVHGEHPAPRVQIAVGAAPLPPAPRGEPSAAVAPPRPPELRVATSAGPPPAAAPSLHFVIRAHTPKDHGPVLQVSGYPEGFVEIAASRVVWMPCAEDRDPAAAVLARDGQLLVVTRQASVLALEPDRPCRRLAAPAIAR
jgi:hypothetical protein